MGAIVAIGGILFIGAVLGVIWGAVSWRIKERHNVKKVISFLFAAVLILFIVNKMPTYFGSNHSLYSQLNTYMLSDDIKKIQGGYLAGTSKVTIASALEGYFSSPRWKEVVYSDMKVVMFQGEFKEGGQTHIFQMVFPKFSEYKWLNNAYETKGQDVLVDFNALPITDTFIDTSLNETKGKEVLIKAYEAAGEKLE